MPAKVKKQARRPIDPKRETLFRVIALSLPVMFFVVLEIGLRVFNYSGNLDLFISAPKDYSAYYMCNPQVGRRYFFMQNTVPDPPNDLFFKVKPENGYRIFVMGGSTAAGYPYANNVMFPRILQHRLADVFPERRIEVVNTAMTAINSYTLLDFMDEILAQQPDVILIYAGHNEFYGALGAASNESLGKIQPFVKFYLKLQRFKTFLLVRNGIGKIKNWIERLTSKGTINDPSATLMERMVGEQTIPYGSPIYELGKRQFERNLREIIKKAKTAGVAVMVSELVSNVRDMKPFVSVEFDTLPKAESVYRLAQQLEKAGNYELAKKQYYRAKDLDALRFRAAEDFNRIIHQVAAEFNAPVAPMKTYFENASRHGLIGNNLMLEHLHPNIDGYFLMADAFFDAMHQHGFIASNWETSRIRPETYYRENWGFTELDSAYADIRIRILKGNWPFQPKSLPNRALVDYRPASKAESLAVNVWLDKSTNLERAHVALAEYYENRGQYEPAFKEYRSLTFITPFNVSPYLRAAQMLIKLQDFARALPYLETSLKLEETAYANKWLGTIMLNDGRVKDALPFLEKAAKLSPEDPQLIYNLSGAYALNKQYDLAKQTLQKLFEITPNFPDAADLKRQLDQIK